MLDRDELAARIYCASIRAYREEVIGIPYELAVKHADGLLAALKTTTYDVNWLPPLKDERPMGIYRTEIPAKDMVGEGEVEAEVGAFVRRVAEIKAEDVALEGLLFVSRIKHEARAVLAHLKAHDAGTISKLDEFAAAALAWFQDANDPAKYGVMNDEAHRTQWRAVKDAYDALAHDAGKGDKGGSDAR